MSIRKNLYFGQLDKSEVEAILQKNADIAAAHNLGDKAVDILIALGEGRATLRPAAAAVAADFEKLTLSQVLELAAAQIDDEALAEELRRRRAALVGVKNML